MNASEAMIQVALQLEGVHEEGFDNRGRLVEELQAHDTIPGGGYAWCASTWVAVADYLSLDHVFPSRSASVGYQRDAFRQKGWLSSRPYRGSIGFWEIGADSWPDHELGVTRVRQLGSTLVLSTIEGNTSPGTAGSQTNGGGVYQRTRLIPAGKISFGTVPGTVDDAKVHAAINHVRQLRGFTPLSWAQKIAAKVPTRKPPAEALYWLWLRWELGEGEFADTNGHYLPRRPTTLPARIPEQWKRQRDLFVDARGKR